MSETLKAGDLLWMVERRGNRNHGMEVEVTKVGRVWAQISSTGDHRRVCGRIGIADLIIDGGNCNSPGRCFRTEEEYEARLRMGEAWDAIRKLVTDAYRRPEHLTLADIQTIAGLLATPTSETDQLGGVGV